MLWANIYEIYWHFRSTRIISLQEKKTVVETISVGITEGSRYFILLDATLGAWQAHDTSVCLIFPALNVRQSNYRF